VRGGRKKREGKGGGREKQNKKEGKKEKGKEEGKRKEKEKKGGEKEKKGGRGRGREKRTREKGGERREKAKWRPGCRCRAWTIVADQRHFPSMAAGRRNTYSWDSPRDTAHLRHSARSRRAGRGVRKEGSSSANRKIFGMSLRGHMATKYRNLPGNLKRRKRVGERFGVAIVPARGVRFGWHYPIRPIIHATVLEVKLEVKIYSFGKSNLV